MVGQLWTNYTLNFTYNIEGRKKECKKGVNIMPPRIDLTNKVFERLTVIKQAENI